MFDVESYIGRYAPNSETRLQRLVFLAEHAPSTEDSQTAYRLLELQLKESGNDVLYRKIFDPMVAQQGGDNVNAAEGASSELEYSMEGAAKIIPMDTAGTLLSAARFDIYIH